MGTLVSSEVISAAQGGDQGALTEVFESLRGLLRSIASEYASNPGQQEELEAVAALSVMNHLEGYRVRGRARLSTYLHPRVRQDVRNAHFADRAGGTMPGIAVHDFLRASAKAGERARALGAERGREVHDGELHQMIRTELENMPNRHWGMEDGTDRISAAHTMMSGAGYAALNADKLEDDIVDPTADLFDRYPDRASRARAVGRIKRDMVDEMLSRLTDRQRAVVVLSFGIGLAPDQHVSGLLEKSIPGVGHPDMALGLTSATLTDADLGEALGIPTRSVKARRKEALDKLRKLFANRLYPTMGRPLTDDEQAVVRAVRDNDEGTYVRIDIESGKPVVTFVVINEEGDRLITWMSLVQAQALGVMCDEAGPVVRVIPTELATPAAPTAHSALYGRAASLVLSNVAEPHRTDMNGVPMGRGGSEVTVRWVDRETNDRDTQLPLWAISPGERTKFLAARRRSRR